jgi:hypothetical protein
MKQSDDYEAYAESVDLEHFVLLVRGLPTVSKGEIHRLLADKQGKGASKLISSNP